MSDDTPTKMGRPRGPNSKGPDEIDAEMVKRLAGIDCTIKEIADIIGTTPETISDYFAEQVRSGRANGAMSLRRKQFERAMDGNIGMLIWLGKQRLGQRDKVALTGEDGGAVEVNVHEARDLLARKLAAMSERAMHVPDAEMPSAPRLPS